MFARYDYNAGTTTAGFANDVKLILTGTTDKTLLSSYCNKTTSYINATVPSGWSVHDTAPGAGKVSLIAPTDDGIMSKYVVLDCGSLTIMTTALYETWSTTTHTGVNATANANLSTYGQKLDLTNGGTLYIGASQYYLFFLGWAGGSFSSNGFSLIGERTRDDAWDTPAAGLPVSFWTCGSFIANDGGSTSIGGAFAPRIKDGTTDKTTSSAFMNINHLGPQLHNNASSGGWQDNLIPRMRIRDATGSPMHAFYLVQVSAMTNQTNYGMLGGHILGGIYMTTGGYGAANDEVTYNGQTYYVAVGGTYTRIVIPKF